MHKSRSGFLIIDGQSDDNGRYYMAAYLISLEGMSPRGAMDEVQRARPIAFSVEGWQNFCFDVLCEHVDK